MGMFDFFRKGKRVEVEVEVESVAFEDVKGWLENKDKVFGEDEREALVKIGGMLEDFYVSVEAKLEVLEGIDIESKKEHGRAKILVRQGLDNYIDSVRVLLKDLRKINMVELGKIVGEIGGVFGRFEKTSAIFYGRANYLVGDEMAAVRNEIRRFYNGLVEMFEGPLIGNLKKVEAVRLKLGEFEKVKKNFEEIEEEIVVRGRKIDGAKGKVRELEKDVEGIKNSAEYVAGLKAGKKVERLGIELNNEIGKLKGLVDFKRLTSIVHSNERELGVVKSYKAHFVSEFSRDGGKRLLDLLEGCNMKSAEIGAKVDLIEKKRGELSEKRGEVGLDLSVGKLKEIEGVKGEIEGMEIEGVKGRRRLEEIGFRLDELKGEVVGLVGEFGGKG